MSKEILWEERFCDSLYQGNYAGEKQIYKTEDGKYFFRVYYANNMTYMGESFEYEITKDDAEKAITIEYVDIAGNRGIDPPYYLEVDCEYCFRH